MDTTNLKSKVEKKATNVFKFETFCFCQRESTREHTQNNLVENGTTFKKRYQSYKFFKFFFQFFNAVLISPKPQTQV